MKHDCNAILLISINTISMAGYISVRYVSWLFTTGRIKGRSHQEKNITVDAENL